MMVRRMISAWSITLGVISLIAAICLLLGCGAPPHPTSGIVREPKSPVFNVLPDTDADLINRLIECYETNVLIWGVTKGGMEARLATVSDGAKLDLSPGDMRPFLEDAALASPEEFRRNGRATLVQCSETDLRTR